MKNESSIFLVNGLTDYEDGRVLGAYSTMAAAESALDTYKANVLADIESCTYDHYEYDDYSITEFIVDAAAA